MSASKAAWCAQSVRRSVGVGKWRSRAMTGAEGVCLAEAIQEMPLSEVGLMGELVGEMERWRNDGLSRS